MGKGCSKRLCPYNLYSCILVGIGLPICRLLLSQSRHQTNAAGQECVTRSFNFTSILLYFLTKIGSHSNQHPFASLLFSFFLEKFLQVKESWKSFHFYLLLLAMLVEYIGMIQTNFPWLCGWIKIINYISIDEDGLTSSCTIALTYKVIKSPKVTYEWSNDFLFILKNGWFSLKFMYAILLIVYLHHLVKFNSP